MDSFKVDDAEMMSPKFGSVNLYLELEKVFVRLQSMYWHIHIIANELIQKQNDTEF